MGKLHTLRGAGSRSIWGSRIAPVHEADIGRVAAVALTEDGHVGKIYTLTGPESLSVQNKVRIISEVIGREIRFVESSEEEEREQMRRMPLNM